MPHHQQVLKTKRARLEAPRGQALVLAALSLLLLGLMVALSFGLSHALRGKTRLQQHSDAMAYSMATVEARSLNYFAVSNRAMAASYVAMNSLHAYMAASTVTSSMLDQGETTTVKFSDFPEIPFGEKVSVKVDVQPVKGETNTTNNTGEFPVIFSFGQ